MKGKGEFDSNNFNQRLEYHKLFFVNKAALSMESLEDIQNAVNWLIQTIEQQQKEIENLTYLFKITQAKLEKLKESICDPRKSNLTGGNHDL